MSNKKIIAHMEYARKNIKSPRWYDESIVNNIITLMDTDYGNGDIEEPEDDSKTKTIKTVTHHLADATNVMRYAYEFLKSYQCEDSKKPRYIEGAVKTFLLESIRLGATHVSLAEEYETILENGEEKNNG